MFFRKICELSDDRTRRFNEYNLHSNLCKNLKFNATFLKFSNIIEQSWSKSQLPEEDINDCEECHWKTHFNALYKFFQVISINIKVHKARKTCNVIAHGTGYIIYTLDSRYRTCFQWHPRQFEQKQNCVETTLWQATFMWFCILHVLSNLSCLKQQCKLWCMNFALISYLVYLRMSFRYQMRDVTEHFVWKESQLHSPINEIIDWSRTFWF
jgi:hypothetical protein